MTDIMVLVLMLGRLRGVTAETGKSGFRCTASGIKSGIRDAIGPAPGTARRLGAATVGNGGFTGTTGLDGAAPGRTGSTGVTATTGTIGMTGVRSTGTSCSTTMGRASANRCSRFFPALNASTRSWLLTPDKHQLMDHDIYFDNLGVNRFKIRAHQLQPIAVIGGDTVFSLDTA